MTNETESIDTAIEQVERLYESVTGRDAPTLEEKPYATIPPERVPEEHVQEQVDRLIQTLAHFSGKPEVEPEWKPQISKLSLGTIAYRDADGKEIAASN